MTEPQKPQRRNLGLPLASVRSTATETPAADDSARETALRHGFDNVPIAASEVDRLRANQNSEPPRRKRGAGRSMPFSVKLSPATMEYIYEVANSRDIPLAQVIEELVEAHREVAK
ncbi:MULTISPECIES: hypothetical protein [Sphingomonadaceae]|jgi:hypothetical protein|uniref:Stability/partitioning determinant n=3 Tax=Sphingomonadaceae TaxID=41297 RepID=A0A0J7XIK8_9SPHN|nr:MULTISPECIES: hypothetical protein [Sphingomonadaceae]KMS51572.1 hypothetical protein V473_23350 [Sphingobium cupriresistens LL01]MDX5986418.1 hypothetical protein [Sphingomonas echinoides]NML12502.1 hypothetical protein [Sphingobium psychrophilum]|tara:strand:- start:32540 stop:32887 length:348 start_codon:yes stop_codon:yes gene_type:complete